MGVGIGGNLGLDEGGILEALNKPIISREVVRTRTTKKGQQIVTTTRMEVSMAHIVTLAVFLKLVALFGGRWEPGSVAGSAAEYLSKKKEEFEQWLSDKGVPSDDDVKRFFGNVWYGLTHLEG